MVKGNQRAQTGNFNSKYVGLTSVEVKAFNPSRKELNKLLGKEDSEDDKEITYLDDDKEGNPRLRLSFWLWDEKLKTHFVHSFNLVNKERVSKDGGKKQYINSVCRTTWADEESNLQPMFTHFLDKDKNEIAKKAYKAALVGEEELGLFLRGWLGRLNWNDTDTEVIVNTKKLFKEDYSEIRDQIDGDYSSSFVILLGVATDENDSEKQYQRVYSKGFLPNGFMNYITKGFKFPTDFSKKAWKKFEEEATGEYGFNCYFELEVVKEYNPDEDPAKSQKATDVAPSNSKY